ncbi:acyl-homoserine-lactone synthase [Massilia scottii]|uniref:acyl-homoserine-lactone synthase n=1 Tax=Massilia scottii TaxID=3057166 RepID=UPI00279686C4|nr:MULTISPECIES: acyl-homoserine-lactone synthase [unclassified Massilia]MDQ1812142.1 acyl-homoserine-lactone synthase [Massilia sp. CCM 9210]MDQ1831255.1 acyl-homoserine-lactone synthase [Massilia sp. CCM 9029]
MALHIRIAARREFKSRDLWEMHTLRAKVFKDRLGWEVPIMSGMEIDGYDALEPLYMMIREPGGGALRGCWRLLPTEGPYMLKDSFAQLLHGQDAPQNERIWELSRFAIETDGNQNFGFSDITMESIGEIISHGHHAGLDQYVTVTTTAIERLLRRAGVLTTRFGDPVQIGVERAVALYIDIAGTYEAMFESRLAS